MAYVVSCEFLTAVLQSMTAFWDVTLCHWVSDLWCFKESLCLHLQGICSSRRGASTGGTAHCTPLLPCHFHWQLLFELF